MASVKLHIRPMAATDLPAVMAIEQVVHIQPWPRVDLERALAKPYRSWVATSPGNTESAILLGYQIFQWLPHEATLMNIAVGAEWQGHGVARELLGHAIQEARQAQLEVIFLEVRESNHAAIGLYERLGFVEIDRRGGYYAHSAQRPSQREAALVMSLPIMPLSI